MNWRFRVILWCQFRLNALVMGTLARLLLRPGDETGLMKAMVEHPAMNAAKKTMVANGGARTLAILEDRVTAFCQSMRPGSQWKFCKDEWSGAEVVVLPRVISSNTGIVTGPPGHPNLGSVVTCDGLPPNCDPPALEMMLNGSPVSAPAPNLGSGHIGAEFVEGAR